MSTNKTDWVICPICGETDMERETDAEGCAIISCVNHCCGSNGGTNFDGLKGRDNSGEAYRLAAEADKHVNRARIALDNLASHLNPNRPA
jgi:hypothetical protein